MKGIYYFVIGAVIIALTFWKINLDDIACACDSSGLWVTGGTP